MNRTSLKDFKKLIPESDHLKTCLDLCKRFGLIVWRQNSGMARYSYQLKTGSAKGIVKSYAVAFGFPGMSDICGIMPSKTGSAIPFFWEVKRAGKRPTGEQLAFIDTMRRAGCYAGWGTADDLLKLLTLKFGMQSERRAVNPIFQNCQP